MSEHLTYKGAGVDSEQQDRIMPNLTHWIERTFENRPNSVKLPLGYFANVIDVGNELAIALSTDGVGTKILVAELMNKYDTIGIDCVAMNVNDVLCVGATPVALLDYVAVEAPHTDLMDPLVRGLHKRPSWPESRFQAVKSPRLPRWFMEYGQATASISWEAASAQSSWTRCSPASTRKTATRLWDCVRPACTVTD